MTTRQTGQSAANAGAAHPMRENPPAPQRVAAAPATTTLPALIHAPAPAPASAPAQRGARKPAFAAQVKEDDSRRLLDDLLLHLRNDKLHVKSKAILQAYEYTCKQFIRQVHKTHLFDQNAAPEQRLDVQQFNEQRQRYIASGKNLRGNTGRVFGDLFDTLFAGDMREMTARFKAFLPKKFEESWDKRGLDVDQRHDISKKIIADLFLLNRSMLSSTGESLPARIRQHYQENQPEQGQQYLQACIERAFNKESDRLRVTRALTAYVEFNIDLFRDGPDAHVADAAHLDEGAYLEDRLARLHDQVAARRLLAGPADTSGIAAPAADALWRLQMESRLRKDGQALVLGRPLELDPGPPALMMRCAGQAEYQPPYLQLDQSGSDSLAPALSIFLRKGYYDFATRPVPLASYRARENEYLGALAPETGMTLTPAQQERMASRLLQDLGAEKTLVNPGLLRHVTRTLQADPQRASEPAQALKYLELLGQPASSFLIRATPGLSRSPDWPVLSALINASGGSNQRILVYQRDKNRQDGGQFVTWLRDTRNREWSQVETRPGVAARHRSTPGKTIGAEFASVATTEVELFFVGQDGADVAPGTRQIDQALQFYQHELGRAPYEQAVQALQDFSGIEAGRWSMYQYLAARQQAAAPSAGEQVEFGNAHQEAVRNLGLRDINGMLNHASGEPAARFVRGPWLGPEPAAAGLPQAQQIQSSVGRLEQSLNRQAGLDSVVLSGWQSSPYYVVARKGADQHWYIAQRDDHSLSAAARAGRQAKGLSQDRSLAEFFTGLELPEGRRLGQISLEMMFLQPAYRDAAARERILQAGNAAVSRSTAQMLGYLEEEEMGLALAAELMASMEEEDVAAAAAQVAAEADAAHAAQAREDDLDSLFGASPPAAAAQPAGAGLALPSSGAPAPAALTRDDAAATPSPDLTDFYVRSNTAGRRARAATVALTRALDGQTVLPGAGAASAQARQFQRKALTHVTSTEPGNQLVLTKRNLLPMIASGRVTLRIDENAGKRILEGLAASAETDDRFAPFLAADDAGENRESIRLALLQAIHSSRARAGAYHLVYFDVPAQAQATAGAAPAPRLRLVAVLQRVPHTEVGEEKLAIVELQENTAARRRELEQRYSPAERWRQRSLNMGRQRAGAVLSALRDDFGGAAEGAAPAFLADGRALCDALEQGLQRTGEVRPARMEGNLWRIVIRDAGRDFPMLVNLRGNQLFNVRRERAGAMQQAIEEATRRGKREKLLMARLWSRDRMAGEPIQRTRRHLNREWLRDHPEAEPGTERFGFFDTVMKIACHPELADDPDSPLKRLGLTIDGGTELNFCALFDNGELIDLREEGGDDAEDMLRLQVSPGLARHLNSVHKTLARADYEDDDAPSQELVRRLDAHNAVHGLGSTQALLDALIVRGGGEVVHADYPDLRRHKIELDAWGEDGEIVSRRIAVLVRSSGAEVIEELHLDSIPAREALLAFHFSAQDRERIARRDRDPRNRVPGHEHGPITHMARLHQLSSQRAGEAPPAELGTQAAMDYLGQVISRRSRQMVHPAYPELALFRTSLRAGDLQKPFHFLGRVQNSALIDVQPEGLASFLKMSWKKGDPGPGLADLQATLGTRMFRAERLAALLQPANMEADLPDPAFPSWRRFTFENRSVLAKVVDGEIQKIINDDEDEAAFDRERRYVLSYRGREQILRLDKKNGNFLERNRASGQTRMDFVTRHVRFRNGRQIAGWPQLHVFNVVSRNGAMLRMLARVEDGEILNAEADSEAARLRLQKTIQKQRAQHFRRISAAEARRIAKQAVPFVVTSMLARQQALDDDQTRATEQSRVQQDLIRRIALRENRDELEQLAQHDAGQARTYDTLAALDGEVADLLEALLETEDWEPVPQRQDMRQYPTDLRADDGEALKIYAYVNEHGQLVDARIGTEKGLEQLQQTRARNLRTLPAVSGSWFSAQEVSEIYLRDHCLRDKKLMELADIGHLTFPELLHRAIPMPRQEGEWEFPGGEAISGNDGQSSPYFRRYFVSRGPGDPAAELHVTFDPVLARDGQVKQIRLADVRLAPPPARQAFRLSLPLLAQVRYLEKFPAQAALPDLAPQIPLVAPATPAGSIGVPSRPPTPLPALARAAAIRSQLPRQAPAGTNARSPGLFVTDDDGGEQGLDTDMLAGQDWAQELDWPGLDDVPALEFDPVPGPLTPSRQPGRAGATNGDPGWFAGLDDLTAGSAPDASDALDRWLADFSGYEPDGQLESWMNDTFRSDLPQDPGPWQAQALAGPATYRPDPLQAAADELSRMTETANELVELGIVDAQDLNGLGGGEPISAIALQEMPDQAMTGLAQGNDPAQLARYGQYGQFDPYARYDEYGQDGQLEQPGRQALAAAGPELLAEAMQTMSPLYSQAEFDALAGLDMSDPFAPFDPLNPLHGFDAMMGLQQAKSPAVASSPAYGRGQYPASVPPALRSRPSSTGASPVGGSPSQAGDAPPPALEFDDPASLPASFTVDPQADLHVFPVLLPPEPVLEEFLPGLRKEFGKKAAQSLTDWLFPDGDAGQFSQRLGAWTQNMTAPHLEAEEIGDAPGLLRFKTTLAGKSGLPVTILGRRKNGVLIAPWNDTKKNRTLLSEQIKNEAAEEPSPAVVSDAPRIDAALARQMAARLVSSERQLDSLASYLLGSKEREKILDRIFSQAGSDPAEIGLTHEVLKRFLVGGIATALEGAPADIRLLKLPTGVMRGKKPLFLHLSLANGAIRYIWIPEPVQKPASQHIKLEKNEPEEELGLAYLPAIRRSARERKSLRLALPAQFLPPSRLSPPSQVSQSPKLPLPARSPQSPDPLSPLLSPLLQASPVRQAAPPARRSPPATRSSQRPGMDGAVAPAQSGQSPGPSAAGTRPASLEQGDVNMRGDAASEDDEAWLQARPRPALKRRGQATPAQRPEKRRFVMRSRRVIDSEESDGGAPPKALSPTPADSAVQAAPGSQAAAMRMRQEILSRTRAMNSLVARAPVSNEPSPAIAVRGGGTQAFLSRTGAGREKPLFGLDQEDAKAPAEGLRKVKPKWSWQGRRAAEFAPFHRLWNKATGENRTGMNFLLHIGELCRLEEARSAGTPIGTDGIAEFQVTPYEGAPPLTVWRHEERNGNLNLRLAPPAADAPARALLGKEMMDDARRSVSDRYVLAADIDYPFQQAHKHWKGEREQEFAGILAALSEIEQVTLGGPLLLRRISAQCDQVLAAGGGRPVDEKGRIVEFVIKLPPLEQSFTVWRKVDRNGGAGGMVSVRLAPPAADSKARAALIKTMEQASRSSVGGRLDVVQGESVYSANDAYAHWRGARAEEFQDILDDWNAAVAGQGVEYSGASLLVRLSDQCRTEEQNGNPGKSIDEAGLLTEFSVRAHEDGPSVRVWRLLGEDGALQLRRAPGKSRKAIGDLQKTMLAAQARSRVLKQKKPQAPAQGFSYTPAMAKKHWAGGRKTEFEDQLASLNARRLQDDDEAGTLSGAKFLVLLHALCDQADADGLGSAVDDDERIFEFSVRTHEALEAITVWRMVGEQVNLHMAPPRQAKQQRASLQTKMLSAARGAATSKAAKPDAALITPYPPEAAKGHWTKNRIADFDALRLLSNRIDKVDRSGSQFLIYLSMLCDLEQAQGRGSRLQGHPHFTEHQVVTHDGAAPIRVLRLVTGPGMISLRLKPPEQQEKKIALVIDSMLLASKKSATRVKRNAESAGRS